VLRDGKSVMAAVVAADSTTNLAVLRLPSQSPRRRRCAAAARSSRVRR